MKENTEQKLRLVRRRLAQYIVLTKPCFVDVNGGDFTLPAYDHDTYHIDLVAKADEDGVITITFISPEMKESEKDKSVRRWISVFAEYVMNMSWEIDYEYIGYCDIKYTVKLT